MFKKKKKLLNGFEGFSRTMALVSEKDEDSRSRERVGNGDLTWKEERALE